VTKRPTVYVVDDDADVLASLAAVLDGAGYDCLTYTSGYDFLAAAPKATECCAIVDVRMPKIDGMSIMEELFRRGIRVPVILMTGFGEVPLAVRAMKAGAVDFIEKPCRFAELQEAIGRALAISTKEHMHGRIEGDAAQRLARLTQREREVFERLIVGDSNKAIARMLDISARTVEIHRARVMEKLEVKNLPELVRLSLAMNTAAPG
jgi:two-component system response regulator FixJ